MFQSQISPVFSRRLRPSGSTSRMSLTLATAPSTSSQSSTEMDMVAGNSDFSRHVMRWLLANQLSAKLRRPGSLKNQSRVPQPPAPCHVTTVYPTSCRTPAEFMNARAMASCPSTCPMRQLPAAR